MYGVYMSDDGGARDRDIINVERQYNRLWTFMDRLDRRSAWAFPLWVPVVVAIGVPFVGIVGSSSILTTVKMDIAAAMMGGWIAFCGAFTLTRPVVRGGFLSYFKKQHITGGASFNPSFEENVEAYERFRDAVATQLVGPALIMAGTLLNGASGLFQFLKV